jgi:hypothetical protein
MRPKQFRSSLLPSPGRGILIGSPDPLLEGSAMSESYAELLERLEATKRSLRNALEFINDDRHLTDEGIVAREALLEEIEAIEQDLEVMIRQEHGLD